MTKGGKPSPANSPDPEGQLKTFIGRFDLRNQVLIRSVRRVLRNRFRTAHELAYDNYNFFVIGYSPTERPSDAIVSLAAGANGVGVCFIHGASLPDPGGVLFGSGRQTRFIRVPSVEILKRREVEALFSAAISHSRVPLPRQGRGRLIIRSVSKKQRPRKRAPQK
jgi:hypothetical protein